MGTVTTKLSAPFGGEATLLDPSGKARHGWGVVDAPPEPPIEAFGNAQAVKFGDVHQPAAGDGQPTGIALEPSTSSVMTSLAELPSSVQDLVLQAYGKGEDIQAGGSGQSATPSKGPQAPGVPGEVQATGEPHWNGNGTYTVPTADGPVVVPKGVPISGYRYSQQAGHYFSNSDGHEVSDPLKISLDGKDAAVNSSNKMTLDQNGQLVKTSGGLNSDEAWLVNDPSGTGAFHAGVWDSSKLIGNQNGAANGYERLAKLYPDAIMTDASGRQYVDTTLAAKEGLKLATADGKEIPANSVIQRIYLDDHAASQYSADGQTSIRQAGEVRYNDGKTALAGDEWYTETQAAQP